MKPSPWAALIGGILVAACGSVFSGCGATCKRIEADRQAFLSRTVSASARDKPHIEITVPFAVAHKVVSKQLDAVEPVPLEVPGLGKLGSFFGDLKLRPTSATLMPARRGRVGLSLGFEVLSHSAAIFSLSVDTEIKPNIDVSSGRIEIGVEPESFENVRPHVDSDSAKRLADIVYGNIPSIVRSLVSQDAVDKAASATVNFLLQRFYASYKDKLLRRVCRVAKLSLALPDVPVERIDLQTVGKEDGALLILVTSKLPVSAGLIPNTESSRGRFITLRLPAQTAAELVNWAMAKGHLPSRFDKKGKPSDTGELWAGLEWMPGERPMKIHLWQLAGSCKRIDLGADAAVAVDNGKLKLNAQGAVIEGSEAAPLTELGIFFASLWKDAVDKTLSTGATLKLEFAGRDVVTTVESASLTKDELSLAISVRASGP